MIHSVALMNDSTKVMTYFSKQGIAMPFSLYVPVVKVVVCMDGTSLHRICYKISLQGKGMSWLISSAIRSK